MIMKRTLWFIFFLLNSLFYLYADSENDSLLKVLDKVISERLIYTQKKEATIKELKKKKAGLNSLEDIYNLNKELIYQYETFVCDSAEQYIHENIKKDLLYLYNELYCLSQCESAGNFFDKKFLRSLKYKPEEVEEVLSSSVDILDKKKTGNNSEIISNIQTVEQVRKYFEDNLLVVCQPNISEEEKSSVLKKVTLEEIKHLYQIVFGISLADKCKKIDAMYRIRDFFENEKRTVDLTKNLY